MNKITDNVYPYCTLHCSNCGPQVKKIDCDEFSPIFIESPTLRLIITVTADYHITIGITYITNTLHNALKDSYERETIDNPSNYITWLKLHFTRIHI